MPGEDTKWRAGQSGNPNGRPKGTRGTRNRLRFTKWMRQLAPDAVEALRDALSDPKNQVNAARVLLAYAWGRPVEMEIVLSEVPDGVFWREAERRQARDERRESAEAPRGTQ